MGRHGACPNAPPALHSVLAQWRPSHFLREQDVDARSIPGFSPSIDAVDLHEHPFSPVAASGYWDLEVVIGHTSHELAFMLAEDDGYRVGMADDDARATCRSDADWDRVAAEHPDEPTHLRLARVLSDRYFREPILEMAARAAAGSRATYVYEFTQRSEVLGGHLGGPALWAPRRPCVLSDLRVPAGDDATNARALGSHHRGCGGPTPG